MRYVFTQWYMGHQAGSDVPESFGKGVAHALELRGIVKAIDEPEQHKAITEPASIKRGPGRPRKFVPSVN